MERKEPDKMTEEEKLRYYKDAYEREKRKGKELAGQLSEAEQKSAELESRLGRIKGSVFWRVSKPLRSFVHWVRRTKERLGYYGSIRGVARKLHAKSIERKARAQHGTASFPDAEEARRQSGEKFMRSIKFSILVPLYNTPGADLRKLGAVSGGRFRCRAWGCGEDLCRICREGSADLIPEASEERGNIRQYERMPRYGVGRLYSAF